MWSPSPAIMCPPAIFHATVRPQVREREGVEMMIAAFDTNRKTASTHTQVTVQTDFSFPVHEKRKDHVLLLLFLHRLLRHH